MEKKEKEKFVCEICSKSYAKRFTLNKHRKLVHKLIIFIPGKIMCPMKDCHNHLRSYYVLRAHLAFHHGIVPEIEDLVFNTKADFLHWKNIIEMREHASFIKRSSRLLNDGTKKIYYFCHRSGSYSSKATGLRTPRKQGTCKIGSHCPSAIEVLETKDRLIVKFYKTHAGHRRPQEIKDAALKHTKDTFKKIENDASVEKGVSHTNTLLELDGSFSEKYHSQYYILQKKAKDLQRIKKALEFENQNMDLTEGESLDLWVKSCCEAENSPVLIYRPESHSADKDSDFALIIMTEYQKHILLASAKKIICVDRIQKRNESRHFVTIVLVMDEHNMAFPVAFCISSKVDKCIMMQFFNAIKQNTGPLKTANFMSDEDEFFYIAWRDVMESEPTWLWSTWAMDLSFRGKLRRTVKSSADARTDIYRRMRAVLECQDEEKFPSMFEAFLKSFPDGNDLEKMENYIREHYSPYVEKWAHCYRKDIEPETNMHLEILHRSLTFLTREGLNKKGVDKYVFILMKLVRDKILDRLSKIEPNKRTLALNNIGWCHTAGIKIPVESVTILSEKQWDVQVCDDRFHVMLDNESCPERCSLVCNECNICVHMFTCTCYDNLINANLCEHIHVVAFTSLDPKFTLPPRSLVCNETNVVEDMEEDGNTPDYDDDPVSDIENSVAADEYFYTALKKTHHLYDTIKSKKISLKKMTLQKIIKNLNECLELCEENEDSDSNFEFNDSKTDSFAVSNVAGINPISNFFFPLAPSINTTPFATIFTPPNVLTNTNSSKEKDTTISLQAKKHPLKPRKKPMIDEKRLSEPGAAAANKNTSHLRPLAPMNSLTNINTFLNIGTPLNTLTNIGAVASAGKSLNVLTAITGTGICTSLNTATSVTSDNGTGSTNLKTMYAITPSMVTSTNSTIATNAPVKGLSNTVFMLAPVSTSSNVKTSVSGTVTSTSNKNLTNKVFVLAAGSRTSNVNISSGQVGIKSTLTDNKSFKATNSTNISSVVGLASSINASTNSMVTTSPTCNNLTNSVFVLAPGNASSTVSGPIPATGSSANATIATTTPGTNLNTVFLLAPGKTSKVSGSLAPTVSSLNTITNSRISTATSGNNLNTVFLLAPGNTSSNIKTATGPITGTGTSINALTNVGSVGGTKPVNLNTMFTLASPMNASASLTPAASPTGNSLTNRLFLLAPGGSPSSVKTTSAVGTAARKSANDLTNPVFVLAAGSAASTVKTGSGPVNVAGTCNNTLKNVGSVDGTKAPNLQTMLALASPIKTSTNLATATSTPSNTLTNAVFVLAPGNASHVKPSSVTGTSINNLTNTPRVLALLSPLTASSTVKTTKTSVFSNAINTKILTALPSSSSSTKTSTRTSAIAKTVSSTMKASNRLKVSTTSRHTSSKVTPTLSSSPKKQRTRSSNRVVRFLIGRSAPVNNLTNNPTVLSLTVPPTTSQAMKTIAATANTVSSTMTAADTLTVSETTEECATISSTVNNEAKVSSPTKLLRSKRGISASPKLHVKHISSSTEKNDSGIVITSVKGKARKTFSNLNKKLTQQKSTS